MFELIFILIWGGGALADPDEKRGFWNRVCWPVSLGAWLYYVVIKANKE